MTSSYCESFITFFEAAVSDHVPTVTLSRKYPPWFDRNVRAAALREQGWRSRGGRGGPDPHGPMQLKKLWGSMGVQHNKLYQHMGPIRT